MKFGYVGLSFAVLSVITSVSFADPDPYKIVTSKAYVDTKQSQIPAGTVGQIVTYSGTAGEFGTPKSVANFSIGTNSSATTIPTTGAVVSAFNSKFPANGGTDKVVTLGASMGAPSSRSITETVSVGGTNIPSASAVHTIGNSKQRKPVCTTTKPGDSRTCYGWTFATSSCIALDESCSTSNDQCCSGTVCYGLKNTVCTACVGVAQACGGKTICCKGLTCDISSGRCISSI